MLRGSKTDEIITLVFMVLAIIAVGCLFFSSDRLYFLVFGGIAIVVRIIQYVLRYIK